MEQRTRTIIDNMNADGTFSCLTQVYVEYNGEEVILNNHRKAFTPGSDISELPDNLKAAVTALWTPAVIAAWEEKMAAEAVSA